MITRKLYEDFTREWSKKMQNDSGHEAKADLGYAFFIAGAAAMASGLGALMENGAPLAAQKVAASVRQDCVAEIMKLKAKYGVNSDLNIGEFKL